MMKALQPPDSLHLQAAEGWIGLGNYAEANEELEKIAPQLRAHPDVLKLRWENRSDLRRGELSRGRPPPVASLTSEPLAPAPHPELPLPFLSLLEPVQLKHEAWKPQFRASARAPMEITNLNKVPALVTKDGSEIRELLAYRNSAIRN